MTEMKNINCIDASYAGGDKGMTITSEMISTSLDLLSNQGSLYIFLIFENNVHTIISQIEKERPNIVCTILAKQRKYNELQYILKCSKINWTTLSQSSSILPFFFHLSFYIYPFQHTSLFQLIPTESSPSS